MGVHFTFATPHDKYGLVIGAPCEHTCSTPECEDWDFYNHCDHTEAQRATCSCRLEVSISNGNAYDVLPRLAFSTEDMAGTCEAADFLARVRRARMRMDNTSNADDAGTDDVVHMGIGKATMYDCGRRPGYFADLFDNLEALCVEADTRGWAVGWS